MKFRAFGHEVDLPSWQGPPSDSQEATLSVIFQERRSLTAEAADKCWRLLVAESGFQLTKAVASAAIDWCKTAPSSSWNVLEQRYMEDAEGQGVLL